MSQVLVALLATAAVVSMGMMMMKNEDIMTSVPEMLARWSSWKTEFNRKYTSVEEELYRFAVFQENLQWIEENQGDSYTLEINQFGDLTREEFKAMYLGYARQQTKPVEIVEDRLSAPILSQSINTTVNWVVLNDTTPVYNQGQCGSCWAFSATQAIESAYSVYKQMYPTPSLSMEQLVQCSSAYGNQGCNGGLMANAFEYVVNNPLNTYVNYPYTSGSGVTGNCNSVLASQGKFSIQSYSNVTANDCSALMAAMNLQPISVAVDASTWSYYKSGIFSLCGKSLDHGVLAVGYVQGQYWLIKNSWGVSWGQNGYIQLKWGNTCGLCSEPSYPNLS